MFVDFVVSMLWVCRFDYCVWFGGCEFLWFGGCCLAGFPVEGLGGALVGLLSLLCSIITGGCCGFGFAKLLGVWCVFWFYDLAGLCFTWLL